nr:transglycosylase SLT domain-containing protein [Azoarcus sp. L1K30]
MGKFAPKLRTSEIDRAFNVAVGTESNGKQFDANGQPLTSSAGAIGIAQVMPDTAPEAAKLAGLAWDEKRYRTDADYNYAIGKAYFAEKLRENSGDLAKAYAAYNAGQGRLQEGMKKAREEGDSAAWLDYMPAETRDYVTKNMKEYGAGGGAHQRPTLADMKAELRAHPQIAGNPARLRAAESALESQFKDIEAAAKQMEDDATDAAYKALYQNGGRMEQLPVDVRAKIPGDKLNAVMNFAQSIAKNGGATHDPKAWAQIVSLPRSDLAAMTPAKFYEQFRPVLDDAHLEKGYALIADAQGNATDKHLDIITTASRIKQAAIEGGILPATGKANDKEVLSFAQFERVVDERVRQFEQVDLGGKRKANSQELQQIVDRTMLDKVYVAEWGRDPQKPVALIAPEQMDKAYVNVGGREVRLSSIPPNQRALIASKMQARGIPVTEQQIAELWVAAGRPQ